MIEPDEEHQVGDLGSGLAAERARRQQQVDDLRAAGRQPYPYRFDRTHSAADVRALGADLGPGEDTDTAVSIGGRVMLKRDTGKLVFLNVADRGHEVQLFVSKSVVGDDTFADVKALDRGDWIGATGTVMTTRTGEISVKVTNLELLAKAIRPLPDKWHGLADADIRYRQRYADLVVNAHGASGLRDPPRRVDELSHDPDGSRIRRGRNADSPHRARRRPRPTIRDPPQHARHPAVPSRRHRAHLKRLIVGGLDRVFEIGRTFRNEGMDATHNPDSR